MQKSHSLRLWVWFITGAVFFSVVLAGALFIYNEKRYDFEKLTEYYSGIAQRAAHDINGLPNTREGFLSVTQRLMALNGLESLFLLGKTGEVQLISGMQNSTTPQRFAVEHLQRAALVKVVNDFAYIAAPLEVDEAAAADFSAPAYFVLAVQVGTLKEHVQRNVIWLGGGLAVISMLTFAILSVFIGHVVKPVEELRAAINATVQGSGVSKLDISGPAEIRDISVAFNDLVGTLTQREARLNQQRELLEEKIDEVRRSEAKFRESDAWFRGIFNSAMDGMVLIDSQGTIIEANPAAFKLFGYTSADMLGKRIEMLMPTEARAQHQSYLDRYLNTGVGVIIGSNAREVIGLNKKGENFAIDLAVSAIPMRDKTYFLGAVRDVTERRLASQELMRARDLALESARMKDAFLANINHELRTPLNGILGTLQLAEMTGNEEERKSYFDIIRSSGQQLLDTINRVLDFARIDAGTMELEQREFNPLSLLATTVRTLGAAMTKNLYLTYLAPSNLSVHMTTDPIRLRQALTHVIENGIKFTEHGGVVVTVGLVVRDAKTWL
ncbi:MAG: PAS domain S-box protein, partial [Gammaproteobacteria bacterium]|nr:PAS domain S-box protein [Gammaproteobacteria bacterium]